MHYSHYITQPITNIVTLCFFIEVNHLTVALFMLLSQSSSTGHTKLRVFSKGIQHNLSLKDTIQDQMWSLTSGNLVP